MAGTLIVMYSLHWSLFWCTFLFFLESSSEVGLCCFYLMSHYVLIHDTCGIICIYISIVLLKRHYIVCTRLCLEICRWQSCKIFGTWYLNPIFFFAYVYQSLVQLCSPTLRRFPPIFSFILFFHDKWKQLTLDEWSLRCTIAFVHFQPIFTWYIIMLPSRKCTRQVNYQLQSNSKLYINPFVKNHILPFEDILD